MHKNIQSQILIIIYTLIIVSSLASNQTQSKSKKNLEPLKIWSGGLVPKGNEIPISKLETFGMQADRSVEQNVSANPHSNCPSSNTPISNEYTSKLKQAPAAVVFSTSAITKPFSVGETLFRDFDYQIQESPIALKDAMFLQAFMSGKKTLKCIRPGRVYFLTGGKNPDSQASELIGQGFSRTNFREIKLFKQDHKTIPCRLYQKDCHAGDIIKYEKWAVPVIFEETPIPVKAPQPKPSKEHVIVAGLQHPVPQVNFNPGPGYADSNRRFGIASSITRTPGGKLVCGFSSGGDKEGSENYGIVVFSHDNGKSWTPPAIVFDQDGDGPIRSDHVTVWTAPSGVLWIMWSEYPKGLTGPHSSLWTITCANPDDENPKWSAPRKLVDEQNLLTTPTVLRDGTWIFPTGTWQRDRLSRPLISKDNGQTFELGGPLHTPNRPDFDEYMVVERSDGGLVIFNRHDGSFLQCESTDQGRSWSEQKPNGLPHTHARFVFMKLLSGAWLLVKHGYIDEKTDRSKLMAFLSRDEGKTWEGGLMLDDRDCSYPFAYQSPDGVIYLSYERQRWCQPEILFARFTQNDVLAGQLGSKKSELKLLINKAGGVAVK